jgi:hypothetical protein
MSRDEDLWRRFEGLEEEKIRGVENFDYLPPPVARYDCHACDMGSDTMGFAHIRPCCSGLGFRTCMSSLMCGDTGGDMVISRPYDWSLNI